MVEEFTYDERIRAGQVLTELAIKAGQKGINCEKAYEKVGEELGREIPTVERKNVTRFARVERQGGYHPKAVFVYDPDKVLPNEGTSIEDNDDQGDEDTNEQFQYPVPSQATYGSSTPQSAPQAVVDDEESQDWVDFSGDLIVHVKSRNPDDELEAKMRATHVWVKKPRK